jgi:hypothetical protein
MSSSTSDLSNGWRAGWHGERFTAVSTDKAANPTSLMGGLKCVMEDLVFEIAA